MKATLEKAWGYQGDNLRGQGYTLLIGSTEYQRSASVRPELKLPESATQQRGVTPAVWLTRVEQPTRIDLARWGQISKEKVAYASAACAVVAGLCHGAGGWIQLSGASAACGRS
jgi:hypothetical protein